MIIALTVVLLLSIASNAFLSVLLIRGIVREGYIELPKRRKDPQLSPHEAAIREWTNIPTASK